MFDLLGGGDVTRISIVTKCLVDITPPDKLCVDHQQLPYSPSTNLVWVN